MMHRVLELWFGVVVVFGSSVGAAGLHAQDVFSSGGVHETFVGSESEEYLRLLQVAGLAPSYPWSMRGFSAVDLDRLAPLDLPHPWAARYSLSADSAVGPRFRLVRPEIRTVYNSAFPYGSNDGAVWAGRGLTTSLQLGGAVRWGPVSLVVAPLAFIAQNAPFDLTPNPDNGRVTFGDPLSPGSIDRPQRFGDEPYTRVDPGQSTVRVDLAGVTAGLSTANEHWGPAIDHPLLLGNNAPGFLHGFLGTAAPADVWVGHVHGRLLWGRLDQSAHFAARGPGNRRFMSGIVAVFTPRGLATLELGGARFFHTAWPEDGIGQNELRQPFEGIFKRGRHPDGDGSEEDASNQLASVFARWVLPESGVELYGEFGREDHSWNLRDLYLEPDHLSAYVLGLRKVWGSPGGERLTSLRAEVLNSAPTHLRRVRNQSFFYTHNRVRQGHTHRGQILGADAAYGGGAAVLAFDRLSPGGRWSVSWTRLVRGIYWEKTGDRRQFEDRRLDVLHAVGAEALLFRGRFEVTAGVTGAYEFERGFEGDAWNVSGHLAVRAGL